MDNCWIQTYSGKVMHPLTPGAHEIDIIDIAHALSMQCRYSGHTQQFYSVAQHCVHVSDACSSENALIGLLHDASEAYCVDIPSPLKPYLSNYKEVEQRIMECILYKFGLPLDIPDEVHCIDKRILLNERDALMTMPPQDWNIAGKPLDNLIIYSYPPSIAKALFLNRFYALYGINNNICPASPQERF